MLKAHRVFPIAAVGRSSARLNIGAVPAFRANGAQKSSGMESASTNFDIKRLDNDTTLLSPVLLKRQDKSLES